MKADTILVYSKQTGGQSVPLTVRLEWYPDGTVKPLMYWIPDGSCYRIRHIYDSTPLALLRERGAGLRFKVRAEVIETPDPCAEYPFAQHDTYLYLADNWFCGQNMIDSRYAHKGKEYIPVTLDVFPNCEYELLYFTARGVRYKIEETLAVEPRASFLAGGAGVWHKVKARQINAGDDEDPDPSVSIRRMAALYFEVNKWFVTIKTT